MHKSHDQATQTRANNCNELRGVWHEVDEQAQVDRSILVLILWFLPSFATKQRFKGEFDPILVLSR